MKQNSFKKSAETVIHICRDIEYRGGVEAVLVDFISLEKSFTHILICTEGTEGERTERLRKEGVSVYYIAGRFFEKVSLAQKIIDLHTRPILHCHLFRPQLLGIFLSGYNRRITTKYCTYASDSQVGKGLSGIIRRTFDNYLLDYLVTFFYKDIIVITNELQRRWRFFKKRLHLIPISTIREYSESRPARILDDELVLMAAARMVKEKQYNLLLESLKHIKFKKLFLLGDGPLKEEIQQYLKHHNIHNVELPGAVSRNKVFEYMDQSDVFLLTSKTEGLPLLIQEAMSRGLPVVATDVGGNSSLIDNQTGVIVSGNTPESFAEGVNSLNGRDIGKMSRASIEKCRDLCSFDKTCSMIVEVYRDSD